MRLSSLRNVLARARRGRGPAAPVADDSDDLPDLFAAPEPAELDETPRPQVWTPTRLAIEEELWGVGFLTPGGSPELLRFATPIGLSAASSLLLVGTGPGGPPLALATDLGVWVSGYEADPDLAARASRRIQRAGAALAKRASVQAWNPHVPEFVSRACHHALAIDAVRDATPEPVLTAIAGALKPHGHVVLVETVAPAPLDPTDPAITAWCRLEGRAPELPQPEAITRGFTRLGFDVRVVEDVSARHMRLAVLGWKHLVRQLARQRPTPERAAAVVAEAEMWTRRIRLMHDGQIRLMRWHAIALG